MPSNFDYFVLFAGMRTGSNFLEVNLNALRDVVCYGEAFNSSFIGYPKRQDILGVTLQQRECDPFTLLNAIKSSGDRIGGFRYFHDHDPRIWETMMDDPRCAKIILSRNPIESYVSWKIARETGQWKLMNFLKRRHAAAQFDVDEYEAFATELQNFQFKIMHGLQERGQTGFFMHYEDIQRSSTLNGLARFLGSKARLEEPDTSIKPQNPASLENKISNFKQTAASLADWDRFDLGAVTNFERRRGPNIPAYYTGSQSALIYMPIPGGPVDTVLDWLARVEGVAEDALDVGLSQKKMRQWKKSHHNHRSFCVISHPLLRLYRSFCQTVLPGNPHNFRRLRAVLNKKFDVSLPDDLSDPAFDEIACRKAFTGYAEFALTTLNGQSGFRIDPYWASQSSIIQGFSEFTSPDFILREEELNAMLPLLIEHRGVTTPISVDLNTDAFPFAIDQIYDPDLEGIIQECYQRDYTIFGFAPWSEHREKQNRR